MFNIFKKNAHNKTAPHKILIIAPSWIGDMMMAHSLFRKIKDYLPGAELGVVAPSWSQPLLSKMPEVSKVFNLPVIHNQLGIKPRWQLAKEIRKEKYSHAIILPRSLKSALLPWMARIPIRISYLGEQRFFFINHIVPFDKKSYKNKLPMTVDRFVYLADYVWGNGKKSEILAPKLIKNEQLSAQVLNKYKVDQHLPKLVLCPGAEYGPSKQWSKNGYALIAQEFIAQGYQVIILGSKNDIETAQEIASMVDRLHDHSEKQMFFNLVGQTNLPEAVDIIASADKVLSNDSGLMHIASALNIPMTVIYGSTSPDMTPPLSKNASIIKTDFDCQPCFKRQCPLNGNKFHQCMKSISTKEVMKSL